MSDDVRIRFSTLVLMTLASGFVGGLGALGVGSQLSPPKAPVAPTAAAAPTPQGLEAASPASAQLLEAPEPGPDSAPEPASGRAPAPAPEPAVPFQAEPLGDGPPFAALDEPLATQSEFVAQTRAKAREGDVDAMLSLAGWMTTEHSQVTYDETKANVWFRRALHMGQGVRGYLRSKTALDYAGLLTQPRDPRRANPEAAISLLRAALEERDTTPTQRISIRLLLARMQVEGQGMPADPEAAFAQVAEAAEAALLKGEKGHATEAACETLAEMLRAGIGCEKDAAMAALWYRRALEASTLRMSGDLLPLLEIYTANPELEGAAAWLEEHGETPQAQFVLGRVYELGKGVAQDDAKAAEHYRAAAKAGHAFAEAFLTSLLRRRPDLVAVEAGGGAE